MIEKNIEGLSHEDSLAQPLPGGNCANWVMGHIVNARNLALGIMGREPLPAPEKYAPYGNEPVTGDANALPWSELVESFQKSQALLEEGLQEMSAEALSGPAPFSPTGNPDETVGSLLSGIVFHEAYHAGQTGLLRRLAGKPGALQAPA